MPTWLERHATAADIKEITLWKSRTPKKKRPKCYQSIKKLTKVIAT